MCPAVMGLSGVPVCPQWAHAALVRLYAREIRACVPDSPRCFVVPRRAYRGASCWVRHWLQREALATGRPQSRHGRGAMGVPPHGWACAGLIRCVGAVRGSGGVGYGSGPLGLLLKVWRGVWCVPGGVPGDAPQPLGVPPGSPPGTCAGPPRTDGQHGGPGVFGYGVSAPMLRTKKGGASGVTPRVVIFLL